MKTSLSKRYQKVSIDGDRFEYHSDKADALGLEHSCWSIYEVTDHMDEVACLGTGLTLIHKHHWNDRKGPVSKVLQNHPTWRDLAHAADELIHESGDAHHSFIEGFEYDDTDGTIVLWTGS